MILKVSLQRDPRLTKRVGARVELKLRDGRTLSEEILYPPGHVQNRLSHKDLREKFFKLAEKVLGKDRATKAAEMILHGEELSNLDGLLDALRAQPEVP